MFHGKCAYCESHVEHVSHAHVEHYRPKGGVSEDQTHPGYYWLGYTWTNLLLACPRCNGRAGKGMQFPVRGQRAMCPGDSLDAEDPLLLDPTGDDDPEEHIGFDVRLDGGIYARSGSDRGATSIRVCDLERVELHLRRQKHLEVLRNLWQAYIWAAERDDQRECEHWMGRIEQTVLNSAEWAGLARAYFRAEGLLD
jgi:uncharacterized protein (TIGR02646 family)